MDKEYQDYCQLRFKEILAETPDAKDDQIAAIIAGEWAQKLANKPIIKADPSTFKDMCTVTTTINIEDSDDEHM